MKKEYWKPVLGYEGLYEVSNLGRVKSLDRWVKGIYNSVQLKRGKIIKPRKTWDNYIVVNLSKDGKMKTVKVHRLVAQAFLPNPDNLPQVNHKDEDKNNNTVDNLEWCTNLYNHRYGTCIKRIAASNCKPVLQYTLDGEFVREWESAKQAEREGEFMATVIAKCCKKKQKTHKGFIFLYKNVY